jgi:trigger factor
MHVDVAARRRLAKGTFVNVTVENLAPCKKLVRIEVEAPAVDAEYENVITEFQHQVSLPGFRPGKVPRERVIRTFAKQIEDEVKKKLIGQNYRQALADQKIHAVGHPDIEEIQFGRGQALQFAATLETAPDFELPSYKELPVKMTAATVTEEDMERALNVLREQRASYRDVERPVQTGDFVVVNYGGTCEGKPITDIVPTARGLTNQQNYWLHVEKDSFIPGFTEQLVGASKGEHRSVTVDFPADFVEQPLAGKKGGFEVDILQVKERNLPAVDEELAKAYGAENLDKFREGVRADLLRELKYKQRTNVRNQLLSALLARITCELPESVVAAETRNVVYDLVRQNQERGVSREMIDEKKEEIYAFANNNAKERVKAAFLMSRIAEKEGIKASHEEISQRIVALASQYQIKPEKLVRQLQERNGFAEIEEQIITSKVLDFLQLHAKVEEISGPTTPA